MPRFFATDPSARQGDRFFLTGDDAFHLARALRCKKGESITVCDGAGTDYMCVLESLGDKECVAVIKQALQNTTEPPARITLFAALPKGDKLEEIVKAAVPLGASCIVPFLSKYCVAKPNPDREERKTARLNKIAAEAAGQSHRGVLPQVLPVCSLDHAIALAGEMDTSLVFYEKGGQRVDILLSSLSAQHAQTPPQTPHIALFVGAEGGFAPEEIDRLMAAGVHPATLGPRILRCELAPIAGLTLILHALGEC